MAAIKDERFNEAYAINRRDNIFPSILGRICFHPCESACRRGTLDQPISICSLKRFVADKIAMQSPAPEKDEQGHIAWEKITKEGLDRCSRLKGAKIAIIGSGPAGLAAARDLAFLGYSPTVFEKLQIPGGMMIVGIPTYRLPKEFVHGELMNLARMGIVIKMGISFGKDVTIDTLKKERFEAVLIATGLHLSRPLEIPGENLPGILKGVEFLRDIALGKSVQIGKRVIVIGGGNVAIDVARAANRLGARELRLVCLENRQEMPAWEHEIEAALEEGIIIENSWGPKAFIPWGARGIFGREEWVKEVVFKECTRVFNDEGRFAPEYNENHLKKWDADTVIVAIGQMADLSFASSEGTPIKTGLLSADEETLATSMPGVFAAGDVFYGPHSVVEAVASGRKAASSIDEYLQKGAVREAKMKKARDLGPLPFDRTADDYDALERATQHTVAPEKRKELTTEVELGLSEEEAETEARRCLKCNLNIFIDDEKCILCGGCVDTCPEDCLRMVSTKEIEAVGQELPEGYALLIDEERCIRCATCVKRCPTDAISIEDRGTA